MERLYRDFLFVILAFVVVTCMINISSVFRCTSSKQDSSNVLPCVVSPMSCTSHSDSANQRAPLSNLTLVWDATSGEDRIEQQINYKPEVDLSRNRIILITGSGDFDVPRGQEKFIQDGCSIKNCEIHRDDKQKVKVDARLFNMMISYNELSIIKRKPGEIWIMYILEGPLATNDYVLLGDVFNWTASFRHDSTIVTPYEKWLPYTNKKNQTLKNYAAGKKKMAAIFVSNCDTSNNRMGYVNELQKYLSVDVYGACGFKQCDRSSELHCFEMLRKDYKFYLAFENSNCRDYITEKFFRNALMYDVLPVTMGAHPDDYKRSAPPNSFIHVEDFESPKHLASYLKYLDENDEQYNEYFKWKGTGDFINTKFWCRLCAMLNDLKKPNLVVQDLGAWWRKPNICIRGDQRWRR
ncbi:glycoprotein 3-alpha-L-fucosyltransferase A-like isoform X2 [Ostrea edulis]|uniref:glycoprotein 3-alpha-L-fucosyltransferase A-like isoform X2 n=1 Tax=Ostrea edulis TaxID=37623 RepID=UPI002095186A|nr:glycoprotein 3-alpha-L-fucosyltransferase A-like isoform X2 [Ostrea edulis]